MNVRAYFRGSGWARSSAVLFGFAIAGFVACSDDPTPEEAKGDPADCRLIANRCHPYSAESDFADECHETGHDGADPARCTELKESCLEACPPREPDAGGGGSSGATSTGGVSGTTATGGSGAAGDGGSVSGGASGESSGGAGGSAGSSAQGGASNGGAAGSGTGANGGTSSGGTAGGAGTSGGAGSGSGSGGTGGGETACERLGRICHDAGAGRAEECHEIGHDGDESVCEEELADCLAVCTDGGM
jgi:hypothetical protein